MGQLFFYQFFQTFPKLLLRNINVVDIYISDDFFQIYVTSQVTEILIESNI